MVRVSGHVVVMGSLNIDLVVGLKRMPNPGETVHGHSFERHAGGKGLNQAVSAARLGASVSMVGAVGDDANGTWLREVLAADGIDATHVAEVPGTSGTAVIEVDDSGENRIVVIAGANGLVTPEQVRTSFAALPEISVLLVQGEVPVECNVEAMRIGNERGATVIVNPAPAWELTPEQLKLTDVLIANQHEAELLTGMEAGTSVDATEAALRLTDAGCSTVIITRGEKGCVWSCDGNTGTVPTFRMTPVDTVGAGDAFSGGLAAALAEGIELGEALRWASAAGGLATTKQGAVPSLPYLAEVKELLEG